MRKSSRETKKPEVFTFPGGSQELARDDDSEEEEDVMESSRTVTKVQSKKRTLVQASVMRVGNESGDLLGAVASSRAVGPDVTKWINSYKANKVEAMVDLVNFILMAAGSGKNWIEHDVDLEALEPEELDVLLSDMMKMMSESEGSKDYPLSVKGKGKGGKSFRDKYKAFWVTWVEKLLSLPRESNGKRVLGHDTLRTAVDQLVALSSMAVVNIRDAVTEAALSVAQAVLQACTTLRGELETVRRQIAAEEGNRSKAQAMQNPRYQACIHQRDTVTKDLEALSELASTVFNSILLHRIQDFHDEVRATAMRHVLDFVRFDMKRPIHVEHLKYLGRACSDYAAQVRMEAVSAIRTLAEDQEVVPYMTEFVAVFADRFVEIAARDIDDSVALEMVEALRSMQKAGLLDSISEEKLDVVDATVFDPEASARVRQEALAFLMDHTEGFEEEAGEDSTDYLDLSMASLTGKGNKANTKGKPAKTDQAKALARRQRAAQQLETLTEYAAHHLGDHFERAHMLAESCLAIRKHSIVYNWPVTIALLLRETDDVITFSLVPAQASILARMFVHCAVDLTARRAALADSGSLNAADRNTVQAWEALNESLHAYLPALLTHFADDESNLAVVVDLLPCVDFSAAEKACKAALKSVLELMEITRAEAVLNKLAAAIAQWLRLGGTIAGTVEAAVREVLGGCWERAVAGTAQLQDVIRRRDEDQESSSAGKRTSGSKRKSKGGSSQGEREEVLLGLQSSMLTLKVFWANLDCRAFMDTDVGAVTDELTEVTEHVPTFAEGETHLSSVLADACVTAANSAVAVMQSAVLWSYKDVLDLGRRMVADLQAPRKQKPPAKKARSEASQVSADSSLSEEEVRAVVELKYEASISIAVDAVVALREKLIDILLTWIGTAPADNDGQQARVQRALQLEAFRVIAEVRNFFPERESQYKFIDRLAYSPSSEVLSGVRRVFEAEGGRIKAQLSGLDPADPHSEAAVAVLSQSLIECILEPVSSNLIFDVENLNRKQAAAVIYYLLDANELVEEKVKGFMRRLKDSSLKKYLEIQLVALRDLYDRNVVPTLQAHLAAESAAENGEDCDFDFTDSDRLLVEGYGKLDLLSCKLAQSLGVGKLKDDAVDLLMRFVKACIDFSVQDPLNVGFASCLVHYLRFLLPPQQRDTQAYLARAIEANGEVADDLDAQRGRNPEDGEQGRYVGYAKLLDLVERVEGKSRPKMTRRKSSTGSHAVNTSFEDSRLLRQAPSPSPARATAAASMRGRVAGAAAAAGKAKAVPRVPVGITSQLSSQALMQEDLELIAGSRYGNNRAVGRSAKASQKPAAGKKTAGTASVGRKVTQKRKVESSSDEEEDEDSGNEDVEVDEEEGEEENDEGADESYEGLSGGAGRRYQQRFTQGLPSQSQTQQSQRRGVSQAQPVAASAPAAGARQRSKAPVSVGGQQVVLGLDIEDIDSDEEEDEQPTQRSGRGSGTSVRGGRVGGGGRGSASSKVSDEIEEDDSGAEASQEESLSRPLPKKRPGGTKRSAASASVADSFAEMDSIPSRRRLRQ